MGLNITLNISSLISFYVELTARWRRCRAIYPACRFALRRANILIAFSEGRFCPVGCKSVLGQSVTVL